MLHFQAIRAVIFSYLTAIEEDLRELILYQFDTDHSVEDLISKARLDELYAEGTNVELLSEVVMALNFAEPWEILSSRDLILDTALQNLLRQHVKSLASFVKLRNQVMHSRPLDAQLISVFYKFVEDAVQLPVAYFPVLKKTYKNIYLDPKSAFDVEIEYDRSGDRVPNNLPTPDFDETGLVGRETELSELMSLITGPWPVITMVGEGAVGKTALALRLAYQILDDEALDYDSIIWVSAKANQLLPTEIKELNNTIKNSLDVFEHIGEFLGADQNSESGFKELIEYLNNFKILLIIDNLETVIDENMRKFLSQINSRDSKILITSSIGIGDFERRYPVPNLNERDAVTLLRSLANSRKVSHLTKCDNQTLVKYCARMLNSPGFIKWYVSLVALGSSPEQALSNPKIFLDFALENVIKFLSEKSLFTLQCISSVGGNKSLSEIAYLTRFEGDELRDIIVELCASNVISLNTKHVNGDIVSSYEVSNLARFYTTNKFKMSNEDLQEIRKRNKEIALERDEVLADRNKDPASKYLKETISYRSQEDAVCGKLLKDAFIKSRAGEYESAKSMIENAKQLAPNFHEIYRVGATINYFAGDFLSAEDDYEIALSMQPSDPVTLYWYAGFKLRALNDTYGSIELLEKALQSDPEATPIKIELSRALTFIEKFEEGRELVKALTEREDLPLKDIRIATDGFIQTYSRQIKKLIQMNLGIDAANLSIEAAESIGALPERGQDHKVKHRIRELIGLMHSVSTMIFDPQRKEKLKDAVRIVEDKARPDMAELMNKNELNSSQADSNGVKIGVCKQVKYDRNFGFLHDPAMSMDYYFKLSSFKSIKPGDLLDFTVSNDNGKEYAKILQVKQSETVSNLKKAKLISCEDDTLGYQLEDGKVLKSATNNFYHLGINPEDMLDAFLQIKTYEIPGTRQVLVCEVQVSEEHHRNFSLFSKIANQKTFTGNILSPIKEKVPGLIEIPDLSVKLTFTFRSISKPYSPNFMNSGLKIKCDLFVEDGKVAVHELRPIMGDMPELAGKRYYASINAAPQDGSTFVFFTVEDTWEGILRKADLVDEAQWNSITQGTLVQCQLSEGLEANSIKAINAHIV